MQPTLSTQRYEAVIFDFDGTLVDSYPWFASVWNDVARRYGLRMVTEQEASALRRMDTGALLRHLGIPLWKVPLIAAHMRRLAARDRHRMALHPGIAEALRDMARAGQRLAVLSSNAEDNVRHALTPGVAVLFEAFACNASLFGKARQLGGLLRRLRVSPGEAIYVGDEIRDFEAARKAGVAFGAVAWGFADADALRGLGPQRFFPEVAQLSHLASPLRGEVSPA